MLILTRKPGDSAVIGDPFNPLGVVRIVSVRGDRVRLAFEFPEDVPVHRDEVVDKIIADATLKEDSHG